MEDCISQEIKQHIWWFHMFSVLGINDRVKNTLRPISIHSCKVWYKLSFCLSSQFSDKCIPQDLKETSSLALFHFLLSFLQAGPGERVSSFNQKDYTLLLSGATESRVSPQNWSKTAFGSSTVWSQWSRMYRKLFKRSRLRKAVPALNVCSQRTGGGETSEQVMVTLKKTGKMAQNAQNGDFTDV